MKQKIYFTCLFITLFTCCTFSQYKTFEAEIDLGGNLQSLSYPDMIKTADNNLIVISTVTCYTPNATTIEGCNRGFELRKMDLSGNVIWMSSITSLGESVVKLFENKDGSLTLFTRGLNFVECGASILSNGKVSYMYRLNSTGDLITKIRINEICELSVEDIIPYGESNFLIAGNTSDYFNEPFRFHVLFLIDQEGALSPIIILGEDRGRNMKLILDQEDNLILFDHRPPYIHLREFDDSFNTIKQDSILKDSSFTMSNFDVKLMNNNNYILSFDQRRTLDEFEFTTMLLDENKTEIERRIIQQTDYASNLIQLENNQLCYSSTVKDDDKTNLLIHYLDPQNLFHIASRKISSDQNQFPQTILETSENQIQITGDYNCCNFDESVGPAKTFVLESEFTLETSSISSIQNKLSVFPNPTRDQITIKGLSENPSSISLFNQQKLIHQYDNLDQLRNTNFSNLSAGIYFLKVQYIYQNPETLKFIKI